MRLLTLTAHNHLIIASMLAVMRHEELGQQFLAVNEQLEHARHQLHMVEDELQKLFGANYEAKVRSLIAETPRASDDLHRATENWESLIVAQAEAQHVVDELEESRRALLAQLEEG